MKTDLALIGIIALSTAIGSYVTYLQWKFKQLWRGMEVLEKEVQSFPSPDDLAKSILKVKVPISQLPPEMQNMVKGMSGLHPPPFMPSPNTPPQTPPTQKQTSYIG